MTKREGKVRDFQRKMFDFLSGQKYNVENYNNIFKKEKEKTLCTHKIYLHPKKTASASKATLVTAHADSTGQQGESWASGHPFSLSTYVPVQRMQLRMKARKRQQKHTQPLRKGMGKCVRHSLGRDSTTQDGNKGPGWVQLWCQGPWSGPRAKQTWFLGTALWTPCPPAPSTLGQGIPLCSAWRAEEGSGIHALGHCDLEP